MDLTELEDNKIQCLTTIATHFGKLAPQKNEAGKIAAIMQAKL